MLNFYRAEFHTIMSGLVVRYYVINGRGHDSGEICAGRNGVVVQGNFPSLLDRDEISAFAQVLWQAQRQYQTLSEGNNPIAYDSDPDCVVEYRKYTFASEDYEVLATRPPQAEGGFKAARGVLADTWNGEPAEVTIRRLRDAD